MHHISHICTSIAAPELGSRYMRVRTFRLLALLNVSYVLRATEKTSEHILVNYFIRPIVASFYLFKTAFVSIVSDIYRKVLLSI